MVGPRLTRTSGPKNKLVKMCGPQHVVQVGVNWIMESFTLGRRSPLAESAWESVCIGTVLFVDCFEY